MMQEVTLGDFPGGGTQPHFLIAGPCVIENEQSGTSPDGRLVEIIELQNHPWFLGTQFHPEYQSRPHAPHPVFRAFIHAALKRKFGR